MSYLDDADHVWEIEESAKDASVLDVQMSLRHMSRPQNNDAEVLELVARGFVGLLDREAGTVFECFETAVVWYYG